MSNLQPHQQRVVQEKNELDVRLTALKQFIGTPMWSSLPVLEIERLSKQVMAMTDYSKVLGERITAFIPMEPIITMRSPSLDDQAIEQQIQAKKLTAPRVTPEQINALMDRVVFTAVVPEGTTSTFVHAYLDGQFLLETGHSACVSPENFDAQIGIDIATRSAEAKARSKLWELEGYALYKELNRE